ncbi:fumarylacetoacetate hydrolase family protein [Rhodococcus sp. NPDC059968]|uniref:fumarylacetoacetate hydrolase family protein n=1 Tax=Rhodococcus sp. NPDC059968 TaxID=3347017 RepID=UPI00366E20E6
MKLVNLHGRPSLVRDDGHVDIERVSEGLFPSFEAVFNHWTAFRDWADTDRTSPVPSQAPLGPAVPRPQQVFGVGFNYAAHVTEAAAHISTSAGPPPLPLIFTKFPSPITGPTDDIELPNETGDYEVELVVVIGTRADRLRVENAWSHVAGLAVGQDISSRGVQFLGPEQHTVGKSFRAFAPIGPYLVTPDELADPTNLMMSCWINGDLRQKSTTSEMIYNVAELVALLSAVTPLESGDLIFTGTPEGVGGLENPPRYLVAGDLIISEIEGLGRMENRCRTAAPGAGLRPALAPLSPVPALSGPSRIDHVN